MEQLQGFDMIYYPPLHINLLIGKGNFHFQYTMRYQKQSFSTGGITLIANLEFITSPFQNLKLSKNLNIQLDTKNAVYLFIYFFT